MKPLAQTFNSAQQPAQSSGVNHFWTWVVELALDPARNSRFPSGTLPAQRYFESTRCVSHNSMNKPDYQAKIDDRRALRTDTLHRATQPRITPPFTSASIHGSPRVLAHAEKRP